MAAAFPAAAQAPVAPGSPGQSTTEIQLDPSQAIALRRAIASASVHGFDPERFVPPELERSLDSADPEVRRRAQRRLWAAALDYARAVHSGAAPRGAFPSNWALRPEPYDPSPGLIEAVTRGRLAEWLAALPPPGPRYAALQQALAHYRDYAKRGWSPLPAGKPLRLGDQDPRAALLRVRLAAEGYDPGSGAAAAFDAPLAAALTQFQRLHGLVADGVLGRETLAALNLPASARLGQIVANMERARWAPRDPPPTRIEVDSGSATLDYYRDGLIQLSMRIIVGRAADPTPMFRDQVEAVVLNPPWNVPVTIAVKEVLPKAQRDPAYLSRNDFIVRPGPGPVSARLQQRAGPKSALGLYKFDMPNGFAVYLHDTPARSLFDGDKRNLSHGCIRLQQPRELAELLLGEDQGMQPSAIAAAVGTGTTQRIVLRRPIPVIVSHWTVAARAGETAFRPDVYGWDAKLAAMVAVPR
jgi:murein L,D-transpeptidase YcbB/YkuD